MTTASQNAAIHVLKAKAGLADDDYRGLMARECNGKTSSRLLDTREANRFIEALRGFAGPNSKLMTRKASATASGPYAPVLQALWIAAWNLGIIRSRDDRALLRFVERMTGLEHTRFLVASHDARVAIEALKAWIAREAGMEWPKRMAQEDDGRAVKRAICQAIARRLVEAGGFKPFCDHVPPWPGDFQQYGASFGLPAGFDYYTAPQWDELANRLGARLRATLAKKADAGKRSAA